MNQSMKTILGTMLAAAYTLSPPTAYAVCPTNVDFEIVVHFSGIDGDSANCPLSVDPVAVVGEDAKLCTSGKPNCMRKKNKSAGPTRVRWRSVPQGMNYAVYFSPFVGPTIKTTPGSDGCADGTIQTTGADTAPPVTEGAVVMYKYTIASTTTASEPVTTCPPLDPDVYIEH